VPPPSDLDPAWVAEAGAILAKFARGALRRDRKRRIQAEDVVQAMWVKLLMRPDLARLAQQSPAEVVFGAFERGMTARTAAQAVRADVRHRKRERPLASLCEGPIDPTPPAAARDDELRRLDPLLRRVLLEGHRTHDARLAASVLGVTDTEFERLLGWAMAHLGDDTDALPCEAGLHPGWLITQPRPQRFAAYRLLAPQGWPMHIWLTESGHREGALRTDLCRAGVSLRRARAQVPSRM
jgi:hypothetical protein